jgi:hypothetical protein
MTEDDSIREVIEQEKRRGSRRRPIDPKARDEARKFREDLKTLIDAGDEQALIRILIARGLKEESPEFQNALRIFRDESKRR